MKDTFLKNLRETLNQHQIENIDEIIDKYERRFILGYEAGMKDEEIIEALDSIEDIVCQYQKKNYDLYLDLTYFSDFEIKQRDYLKQSFVFDFEDEEDLVKKYVQIDEVNKCIKLNKTEDCAEELSGAFYIGPTTGFDKVHIITKFCDVEINLLKAKEIDIKNISGDFSIDKIQADDIKVETISGDMEIDELVSNHLVLTSTSGDISVGKLNVEEIDITLVSGDLEIDQVNVGSGKISSVSGDITYSVGENQTNNVSITTVSGTIEEE